VRNKHIEFFEAPFVEQEINTFAGSKFTLIVLGVDTLLASAKLGFFSFVDQMLDLVFNSHDQV